MKTYSNCKPLVCYVVLALYTLRSGSEWVICTYPKCPRLQFNYFFMFPPFQPFALLRSGVFSIPNAKVCNPAKFCTSCNYIVNNLLKCLTFSPLLGRLSIRSVSAFNSPFYVFQVEFQHCHTAVLRYTSGGLFVCTRPSALTSRKTLLLRGASRRCHHHL